MNPVIESLQDLLPKPEPKVLSREEIIASDPFAVLDAIHGPLPPSKDFDVPLCGYELNKPKRKK